MKNDRIQSIQLAPFWNYYRGVVRTDNSQYVRQFNGTFNGVLYNTNYANSGRYPGIVGFTKKNMATIQKQVRARMVAQGVPSAAVTQINTQFKKWFMGYYGY